MSGPYCETCTHFYKTLLARDFGECTDPTKIIYSSDGNRVNGPPEVNNKYDCMNHKGDQEVTEQ